MDRFTYNRRPKVLFCTGAGASKESGINTFRDPLEGLWNNVDPMKMASIGALNEDPKSVNLFYNERREKLGEVYPNAFHEYIKEIEIEYGSDRVAVLTTNVDDLHERTGIENLHKIHGNLREIVTFEGEVKDLKYGSVKGEELISCRPNVVLFGEGGYTNRNGKFFDPYNKVFKVIERLNDHDLIFIVGCSSVIVDFPYIAENNHKKNVHIVNPFFEEGMLRSGKEIVIEKSACDSISDMKKIIKLFMS